MCQCAAWCVSFNANLFDVKEKLLLFCIVLQLFCISTTNNEYLLLVVATIYSANQNLLTTLIYFFVLN